MDILNLWNDDPEELLLDLGFGCDEPDLSGRIPARFINHQSQARGINLQVFLEAQKNRLDLENPDVSNRFRQLEVLQQVTTAFSSLVSSDLPAEARERRKRVGMLFRRASKRSLSQIHNHTTQEEVGLNPLEEEEQGPGPYSDQESRIQEGALRAGTEPSVRKSPRQARESFEMEEVHSFDESSVTGSFTGWADSVRGVVRANSVQSDSSGFLEEPFIPSLPPEASPRPALIKVLLGRSGGVTDGDGPAVPPQSSSSTPPPSSADDSAVLSPPFLMKPDSSDMDSQPDLDPLASPACLFDPVYVDHGPDSSTPQFQTTSVSDPASSTSVDPPYCPLQPASVTAAAEDVQPQDKDTSPPVPPPVPPTSSPVPPTSSPVPPTSPLVPPTSPPVPPTSSPVPPTSPLVPPTSPPVPPTSSPVPPTSPLVPPTSPPVPPTSPPVPPTSPPVPPTSSPVPPTSPPVPPTSPPAPPTRSFDSDRTSSTGSQSVSISTGSPPTSASAAAQSDSTCRNQGGKPPQEDPNSDGSSTVVPYSPLVPSTSSAESPIQSLEELPTPHSDAKMEKKAAPSSSSSNFQGTEPSCVYLDSSKFDPLVPLCKSTSLASDSTDVVIDPAVEPSLCQQDESVSPVHDGVHVEAYVLSDSKERLQRNENQEDKRHSDPAQTQTDIYSLKTESSAGLTESSRLVSEEEYHKRETDPQIPSDTCEELLTETKQKESSEVFQVDIDRKDNEYNQSSSVSSEKVSEAPKVSDLVEIESLDQVFETSVDGSEGEYGDVEAFFQELDSAGHAYWAEPVQVSDVTPQSESFEALDDAPGNPLFSRFDASLDADSLTDKATVKPSSSSASEDVDHGAAVKTHTVHSDSLTSTTPEHKPPNHSVSVQMSSCPSSHIVQRKDVPFINDSKHTAVPARLRLDTSTPFRAVQSWTDLRIHQKTRTNKRSHGASHTFPDTVTVSTGALELTQTPARMSLSSPSVPLLSDDWQSNYCPPGITRSYPTLSMSVDTGLWPHEEGKVERSGKDDEERLWRDDGRGEASLCCCDRQCICCTHNTYNRQQPLLSIPYSLHELEEMILCLQQFRSVLSTMEDQLSEDQAAVYSALTDQDREKIQDIEELREAIKQEAAELELQLSELAHHYDDNLKMKMQKLLDEQSLLCSQLRVVPPSPVHRSSSPAHCRTVATQCCLLPWPLLADTQRSHISAWGTWDVGSAPHLPHQTAGFCPGLGSPPAKADKIDLVGFLHRLKESLRHSVNTDSME
ncbi:flocculation protein FLO11-like [Sphaeramia orbicularis]|uniref:flocculation protein FLO11-like n=1 Tax=Sphaeramia orbicularis TaxID=375764 RepID=UPI00117EA85B|nr:flocculation protein FLO11-like [Sphaeramia orbicularis]